VRRGRYYLGRVVKLGELDQERLLYAIREPKAISVGQFQWTFTDTVDATGSDDGFIFSRLSKYSQEGHVTVVDTTTKSRRDSVAENLLIASAPFVYLPEFSGIAYLHVWNGIEESVFRRRFSSLIEESYDNFFVSCEIDPISDYRAFVTKLKALDSFSEIRAKVHPPNPLFGDLWKELNEYIKSRNASEVQVAEKSDKNDGLSTELVNLINAILEERINDVPHPASLTDAALLMAADGYGSGKVIGVSRSESVIIRTSDTQKSFLFDKEPLVDEIASETRKRFKVISKEREMQH